MSGITARSRSWLIAIFFPLILPAQQHISGIFDLPDDPDVGVYYKTGPGWAEMLPEIVNWKTGGVLKHIGSLGVVKGDVNGHINLSHSRNILTPQDVIVIYTAPGVSVTEYQLLRLHENSSAREFRTFTGGVLHKSGGAERDMLQFDVKRLARGVYQILLPNLSDGEYGFLAPGAPMSRDAASLGKIHTFRVGIPKDASFTADARVPAPPEGAQPAKPMTNRDVFNLKAAGFSDDLVVGKIKSSSGSYQLDTEDILALKKANISDAVIQAMLEAPRRAPQPQPAAMPPMPAPAPASPNIPGESPAPSRSALTPVSITSTPSGARITINGYPAGVTPAVVKLPPGAYKMTLQAEGIRAHTEDIQVEAGHANSFAVALDGSK